MTQKATPVSTSTMSHRSVVTFELIRPSSNSLPQKASSSQSYTHETSHTSLISSLLKSLSTYFSEHYSAASSGSAYTVCTSPSSSTDLSILLVANKYSPSNFWTGRWRSTFTYSTSTQELSGTIKVNVHYYEDGNVALTTNKSVKADNAGNSGAEIVRKIAATEKAYQEELNRGFVSLNETSFKGLRRPLPVTRQKVEWEKVAGYKLGSDLRGGGGR